jgi:hypothetical protein
MFACKNYAKWMAIKNFIYYQIDISIRNNYYLKLLEKLGRAGNRNCEINFTIFSPLNRS